MARSFRWVAGVDRGRADHIDQGSSNRQAPESPPLVFHCRRKWLTIRHVLRYRSDSQATHSGAADRNQTLVVSTGATGRHSRAPRGRASVSYREIRRSRPKPTVPARTLHLPRLWLCLSRAHPSDASQPVSPLPERIDHCAPLWNRTRPEPVGRPLTISLTSGATQISMHIQTVPFFLHFCL